MRPVAAPNLAVLIVGLPSRGRLLSRQGDSHLPILLVAVRALLLDGNSKHHLLHRHSIRNHDSTAWPQMMTASRLIEVLTGETRRPHKPLHQYQHQSQLNRSPICSLTHKNSNHLNLYLQDQPSHPLDQRHRPSDLHLLSQDLRHDQLERYLLLALLPCKRQHSTGSKARLTLSEVTMLLLTHRIHLHYRLFHQHIPWPSSFYAIGP